MSLSFTNGSRPGSPLPLIPWRSIYHTPKKNSTTLHFNWHHYRRLISGNLTCRIYSLNMSCTNIVLLRQKFSPLVSPPTRWYGSFCDLPLFNPSTVLRFLCLIIFSPSVTFLSWCTSHSFLLLFYDVFEGHIYWPSPPTLLLQPTLYQYLYKKYVVYVLRIGQGSSYLSPSVHE